jgi:hypothetical protein
LARLALGPAQQPTTRHSRCIPAPPTVLPLPRFLYDDRGSQLYTAITQLPEYYPYRTERALLAQHAAGIAAHIPAGSVVVELGCGDSTKTSILLEELLRRHGSKGFRFCGLDCSAEALRQTQGSLQRLLPGLPAEQVGRGRGRGRGRVSRPGEADICSWGEAVQTFGRMVTRVTSGITAPSWHC